MGTINFDRFTGSNDEPVRCATCGEEISETELYDRYGDTDDPYPSPVYHDHCTPAPAPGTKEPFVMPAGALAGDAAYYEAATAWSATHCGNCNSVLNADGTCPECPCPTCGVYHPPELDCPPLSGSEPVSAPATLVKGQPVRYVFGGKTWVGTVHGDYPHDPASVLVTREGSTGIYLVLRAHVTPLEAVPAPSPATDLTRALTEMDRIVGELGVYGEPFMMDALEAMRKAIHALADNITK